MALSERIYKFIDDVGGVGPNNETRVRNLCKEVAKIEEELESYQRLDEEGYASLAVDLAKAEAENKALREGIERASNCLYWNMRDKAKSILDALIGKG